MHACVCVCDGCVRDVSVLEDEMIMQQMVVFRADEVVGAGTGDCGYGF